MLILKEFNFCWNNADYGFGNPIPYLMFILNINIQNNYINIFTDNIRIGSVEYCNLLDNK